MSDQLGFSSLSAAAHALRGAENSSIKDQINFVSDALLQGRRVRKIAGSTNLEGGMPIAAWDVLDNISAQIAKANISGMDLEKCELPYEEIKQDLEILDQFAKKVVTDFKAEELEISKDVQKKLALAKAEAISVIALSEVFKRVQTVENRYRRDPQMSPVEYRDELREICKNLSKLEDTINRQELCEGSLLKERLSQVKKEYAIAAELSKMQEHPGIVGGTALNLLQMSADMIQQAKTIQEVQHAVDMATEAQLAIQRSSKHFQESGLFFEKLIQEIVAYFVYKRIRELELAVKKPVYFIPTETAQNEKLVEQFKGQKEKLIVCYSLAAKWGGLHREELEERIAVVYEKINSRATSMHRLILEGVKKIPDSQLNTKMSELATKLIYVSELGNEEIKPEKIFSESRRVETIQES